MSRQGLRVALAFAVAGTMLMQAAAVQADTHAGDAYAVTTLRNAELNMEAEKRERTLIQPETQPQSEKPAVQVLEIRDGGVKPVDPSQVMVR